MKNFKLNLFVFLLFFFIGLENAQSGGANETEERENENIKQNSLFSVVLSFVFKKIDSEGKSFMMGSPREEKERDIDEGGEDGNPVKVTFSYSFAIMVTEVTQRQWVDVMGENPSFFKEQRFCVDSYQSIDTDKGVVTLCPNHPVENISWYEVQNFIDKLNKRLGLKGCYGMPKVSAKCLRLPTEAEWEFAARGGTTTAYSFGDDPTLLDKYGQYAENSNKQTHRIRAKEANPFGLYDMHGNVWEWVQDIYKENLPGGEDPIENITSSLTPLRAIRGGSGNESTKYLRSAYRSNGRPEQGYNVVGFRLAKNL